MWDETILGAALDLLATEWIDDAPKPHRSGARTKAVIIEACRRVRSGVGDGWEQMVRDDAARLWGFGCKRRQEEFYDPTDDDQLAASIRHLIAWLRGEAD